MDLVAAVEQLHTEVKEKEVNDESSVTSRRLVAGLSVFVKETW